MNDGGSEFEALLAETAASIAEARASHQVTRVVHATVDRCRRQLGFDRATIWRVPARGEDELRLTRIDQPAHLPTPEARMSAREHFPWSLARIVRGEPVILATLDDLPADASRDLETFRHFETRSTAILPLSARGEVYGAVSFAMTVAERPFDPELRRRLELVAHLLSSALARADAERAIGEVTRRLIRAQERERSRIARELHDGPSQELAVLAVELELLGMQAQSATADLPERAGRLADAVKAVASDVHRLSHGLHPAKLERLGLIAALRGFCREMEATEHLRVQFAADGVPEGLPPDFALALYRVAQEGLWNAARHSGAAQASLSLRGRGDAIELEVRDDGRGFDLAAVPPATSLGLLGMRERVSMFEGEIEWTVHRGAGTTVRARLPLPDRSTG